MTTSDYADTCRVALAPEQAASLADTDHLAHVDRTQVHHIWNRAYRRLMAVRGQSEPSAPAIQEQMAQHYPIVSRFHVPSKDAYIGMGLFYWRTFR